MEGVKIHGLADVQSSTIGVDTQIWQFVVILKGAVIGKNCNINCNVFIENDVVVGDNVTVKSGVQLWDGVTVEDNCFIGPNVTFTNDLVPRSKVYPERFEKTILRKGCSIGANSTLIGGIEIGEGALIGAGSVVTKSAEPYGVYYGNPAKLKGHITSEGKIISVEQKE